MSISSVMTLKSIVPVPTRLNPLISVPCKRNGLSPPRMNSPVTVSSTHQANRKDSKSIPPSSERTIVTSCSSAERIEPGRGVCTSCGCGPRPSTTIHLTEDSFSVASTPCGGKQPTDQVNGMVPEVGGDSSSTFQMPSYVCAEYV